MADSNTLFLLVSYTVFVSVLQNILFTEATILILKYVYFCIVFAKDDNSATISGFPSTFISVSASTPAGTVIIFSVPASIICGFKFFFP